MPTRSPDESQLTFDRVSGLLDYNPASGVFTWKVKKGRSEPGTIAGRISKIGYIYIGIDGASYCAHRIAWLLATGGWPKGVIDHENGNPSDNRIKNLRDATKGQNQRNSKLHRDSSSGLKGAGKNKHKWIGRICIDGKHIHLGMFDTPQEAHAAYLKAAARLHGRFARAS